jgi:V/A-type H+-transporting ATPase subunit E
MSAFISKKGNGCFMNDNNLNEFIDTINGEIDKQITQIEKSSERKGKKIISSAEDSALNKAYQKIKNCRTEEEYKSRLTVSRAMQDARIRVLTHRESLVATIFDNITDKLNEFTHSDEYVNYLASLVEKEQTDENSVVYIRKEDMKYEQTLKKLVDPGCKVEADDTIVLGGLSVYNRTTSVLVNKTIDDMLEEQIKSFGSKYRLV